MLGILASILQVFGYGLYIRHTLREEIDPNPSSWLMWAYGTALIALLEWDRGAPLEVLLLPVVCAACSIFVAYLAWRKNKRLFPTHQADWAAFLADVALTVGYVTAALLVAFNLLNEEGKGMATLVFLLLSNATTITTFSPMIRNLWVNPHHESQSPWLMWTLAYAFLALATWFEYGLWSEFMIYPVLNLIFHPLVFWLIRPARRLT